MNDVALTYVNSSGTWICDVADFGRTTLRRIALIRHHIFFKAACLTLLGLSSLTLVQAQTQTIYPSKRFTVAPTAIESTYNIQPQIQPNPPFVISEKAAENDYTPPLPREVANLLKAGKVTSTVRGKMAKFFPG